MTAPVTAPVTAPLAIASAAPLAALVVLVVIVPILGLIATVLVGGRAVERVALAALLATAAVALAVVWTVAATGTPPSVFVGGWMPPLGVELRADGFSAFMLAVTSTVTVAIGLFSLSAPGAATPRMKPAFWMLLLAIVAALDLAFVAQDLFTLYVALELLTFAAVPLVCLDGKASQLRAALDYLLFALAGSVLYLVGAVVLYGLAGTLDIALLAGRLDGGPGVAAALALMTMGLAAKAALFPFYLWLPPAHSGAPAAASAILSAVVVKAPIFLVVRLWIDVAPPGLEAAAAPLLALLGAASILFCGLVALAQPRLKLLVAYSTAAQLGYLFLAFPLALATAGAGAEWSALAWGGGALHLAAHALAKAAMFMAAGLILEAVGHDRLDGLAGIGRVLPMSVAAFGLGGLSLMGLPPSGGFVAKVMLLSSAANQGAWWIAIVILTGGLLAGGYVLRFVVPALYRTDCGATRPVSRWREAIALTLALAAVGVGFVPLEPSGLLTVGRVPAWHAGEAAPPPTTAAARPEAPP